MNILVTNDDGYTSKGIRTLARMMRRFGDVTVISPMKHQSGMGMAVSIGLKQIRYKDLGTDKDGIRWSWLDATPASCVKFGFNFMDPQPDVVISGINHGHNATSAACYSGTLGAAEEAALYGTPSFGVSLDSLHNDADFSCVEALFPDLFTRLMAALPQRYGIFYNINFPDLPTELIKGIRVAHQGKGKWIKEFNEWNPEIFKRFGITPESVGLSPNPVLEEGEKMFMMVGQYVDDDENQPDADNRLLEEGFITITADNLDKTDYVENKRLIDIGFNQDFSK